MHGNEQSDFAGAIQKCLNMLNHAVQEITDNALADIKHTTVDRVLNCGIIATNIKNIEHAMAKKSEEEMISAEVMQEIIENHRRNMRLELMQMMSEHIYELGVFLKRETLTRCSLTRELIDQSFVKYQPILQFLENMEQQTDSEKAGDEKQARAFRPPDEWSDKQKELDDYFTSLLRDTLEDVSRKAASKEEREYVHSLFESLRLGKELHEKAKQANSRSEQLSAAVQKISDAYRILQQALHPPHL